MRLSVENSPGIYVLECTGNDKLYVGSAHNLRARKLRHFNELRQGKHCNPKLQNAWNKYGAAAFIFYPLEFCPKADLQVLEAYWIRALASVERGFNLAYDTVAPFTGRRHSSKWCAAAAKWARAFATGRKASPQTRALMSASHRGTSNGMYGRRHAPATRKLLREAWARRKGEL